MLVNIAIFISLKKTRCPDHMNYQLVYFEKQKHETIVYIHFIKHHNIRVWFIKVIMIPIELFKT